ncbi:hypothetical protein NQ314_001544 [Rhamnusium bicolor]|uniref:Dopa decarboxylase n=1 Tax=Rhamnusium bicolor TaxID=1586634 RepID=A0AAV8ZV42_9CUCU|nr:hypothetical protein NQ314_001544 [Rhamnusium bicolor]
MNIEEFREFGKASVDYIADYFENIRKIEVISQVEPGYLKNDLSEKAPLTGEPWQDVLQDVDKFIVPGLTHWHSPHFHAYFPTANSFPGIVGELFLSGLGSLSKDWNAASESTLVGLLCGIQRTVRNTLKLNLHLTKEQIKGKLVAYTSKESNSSVEKAGLLASVAMRLLPTDENGSLRGNILLDAIKRDKEAGLIPCCVVATLGTTGTCAFDNLEELGEICNKEDIWLHVDAAYAGAAFACPEYRYLMKGVQYTDSFNFNPHKWMLVNSDCSALWLKNTKDVEEALKVKSTLSKSSSFEHDIHQWQIPSSRRFRALKLWFVIRIYGVEGIQKHIRHQISLAKYFEHLARSDDRFEVCISSMGLVCFRLKGEDRLTQDLLDKIFKKEEDILDALLLQRKNWWLDL